MPLTALTGLSLLALAPAAGAFDIGFPVDCILGETCFIQNYFDHNPGPDMQDFHCGALGYDGHDGTDIALPTAADLKTGFTIRAVAPGKVLGTRNSVADNPPGGGVPVFPEGQDCGNGVVIDHGDGWQSQYCHMAPGSVRVKTGDQLDKGAALGLMGLSGNTQFPHLHLTLRKDGQSLDPFAPGGANCLLPDATAAEGNLWAEPIAYQPGGIIGMGVAVEPVDFISVKTGLPAISTLPPDAPALIAWAYLFGTRSGDEIRLILTGPDGVLVDEVQLLDRTQAQAFRLLGRKRGEALWPRGAWTATAIHLRGGAELSRQDTRFTVE